MKITTKKYLSLILAGVCSVSTPVSSFASGEFYTDAYAYGPGIDNLSSSDQYARYQWGLRNEGDLEYVEVINKFEDANPTLAAIVDFANQFSLQLPASVSGPDTYKQQSTTAKAGIDINIQPAWKQYDEDTSEHRQVIVAVIDTGIDISHPELADSIWVNEDEIPGDDIDNDGNGYVDDVNGWSFFNRSEKVYWGKEDDHGTHSAGTIAATRGNQGIAGIADPTYVKIMPLKALGTESGIGEVGDIIDAIKYAEANGASICNLSFGSDVNYPELEQVMRDSKMLFIVSAGNGDASGKGVNMDEAENATYPASYDLDNVISVANLMFDGNLDTSSNYGLKTVDIAAPGTFIVSTTPENGYGFMSGTSMAAPMVTGVAAMVYSCRQDLDLAGVRTAILNSARKLPSLEGKIATGGMLDAYAALNYGKIE
jgi:subtilisin family serine protease